MSLRSDLCAIIALTLLAASHVAAEPAAPAGAALEQARTYLHTGRYVEAEKAFRAAAKGSQTGAARAGLARTFLETGRYADAETLARRLTHDSSQHVSAYTLLGEALEARGALDEAEAAYRAATSTPGALRAHVRLGRLLHARGRIEQAKPHLDALIDAYNDDALGPDRAAALSYVAIAAQLLDSPHDANDAFREAALADRSRAETQIEWAALFLDKRDLPHASESVDEALRNNPNSAQAHVLKARLEIDQAYDFPAANEQLRLAEAVNPNLVSLHVTRAMMSLRNMALTEADAHLDRALAINAHDLEALSVRAAVRFLADDESGFAQAQKDVLAQNPRFSRMYSIIARYAEWEHRYEELVQLARAALRIDPEDALAHATLGINLLRTGDERGGLDALNAAWDRDRFNVYVYNTLNLYDEVIRKDYVEIDAKPFVIRMHHDERRALEPYVVPALRTAYAQLRERYHFTPEGPLRVELYADRRHFSVRTTGTPNVAVQGVCFGKVITAISPRGGPFNWGQITWHELAHVFHLQLSRSRVPRWFTEGLAEHETSLAHPEWRREEDRALWLALQHDAVPAIGDLNRAFTEARSPDDLMTAYYAASVAVGYVAQRFGFDKIRAMLVAWGEGKRTPDVFAQVLGLDLTTLDADFRAHLHKRLERFDQQFHVDFAKYGSLEAVEQAVQEAPNDPDRLADLALVHLVHEQYAEAEQAGLKAIKLAPQHAVGHFALTRVALEKGDIQRAYRCLQAIIKGGTDGPIVRQLLTRAALALHKPQEAREHVLTAARLDPDDIEIWRAALDVAEKANDRALARRALSAIVDLDQHDGAAHIALLALLEGERDYTTLVHYAERALFVDPENPGLHRQLGLGYLHTGAPDRALVELDRALALGYRKPARVQVLRVRVLQALGRPKAARDAAQRAVREDPAVRSQVRDVLGK